jgi:hypothetical protein
MSYAIRLPANRVLQDKIGCLLKRPSGDRRMRCAAFARKAIEVARG